MFIRSVGLTCSAGANTLAYSVGSQDDLFLLGANLEEIDASDNPQPDSGSIWIQDPQVDDAISLCHGGLSNGQLSGFGCIPLPMGSMIIGKVWHARAGYHAKLNLQLARLNDIRGMNLSPNWVQANKAHQTMPCGRLKVVQNSGAATVTTVDLRPEDGYIWAILDAWALHDDATARTMGWQYFDGTTTITKETTTSAKSAAARNYLTSMTNNQYGGSLSGLPQLSYDVYAQATIAALAAGKILTVEALVLEFAE